MQTSTPDSLPLVQGKINSFFNRTIKSKFVRNVAIVASGTAAAQAITLAYAPVITRIYGPDAFGLLGVFMALVAIMTSIAALTYPMAIVLPKGDADAKGLVKLSIFIALAVSLFVAIALLVGGEWLLALLGSEAISAYSMLIPLSMLFTACMQIAGQWLIRKKQYGVTAKVAIFQSFILNNAKAGIGWFNPIGAVLVILATAGPALQAAMLWAGIDHSKSLQNAVADKSSLKDLALRHYDFPLYRAPQVLINAISQGMPVLMLASFFGPASAGFYTIGRSVLGLPSRLISDSVGDVFYPRITEAAHNGESLSKLILKGTVLLAVVGFVPFAIVVAFGPWLFSFAFGAEWGKAGEYARWVSLWLFFMVLNNPSVKALPILSAQKFHLVFTIFTISIRLLSLGAGYYVFDSDLIAIALYGIAGAITNIVLIRIVMYLSRRFDDLRCEV
jgi:O-antigen/teichoic acid export membrane protein